MDLNALGKQLSTTEKQLSQYTADLPSQIESQIQKAYTPALQQSLNTTKQQMGDYLNRYFDTTSMGPGMAGTTALDLSPTQKLGVMGRELGTMAGELQSTQKFSDYLGGQMSDMYNKALTAMQMGQQNLADQYSRQFQQYQLAWQEAEAAKDRALQSSIARQNQIDLAKYFNNNTQTSAGPTANDYLNKLKSDANNIAKLRGTTNTFAYKGQRVGNIDAVHSFLMNAANKAGLNLNPEWLWVQLGNSTNMSPVPLL